LLALVSSHNFEIVRNYTYLHTILTNKNELKPQLEKNNYEYKLSIVCTLPPLKNQSGIRDEKNMSVRY